ncbi:hypothetical protein BB561_001348 [Smittium simulii]|uniref:Uncharacterized protein n=1 Tax=Smittium simulii TaxID=133385 RepID=A0A2T9YV07_9FUNG|nr:hypothetical protein BB561_001348 [Smittium simulii]
MFLNGRSSPLSSFSNCENLEQTNKNQPYKQNTKPSLIPSSKNIPLLRSREKNNFISLLPSENLDNPAANSVHNTFNFLPPFSESNNDIVTTPTLSQQVASDTPDSPLCLSNVSIPKKNYKNANKLLKNNIPSSLNTFTYKSSPKKHSNFNNNLQKIKPSNDVSLNSNDSAKINFDFLNNNNSKLDVSCSSNVQFPPLDSKVPVDFPQIPLLDNPSLILKDPSFSYNNNINSQSSFLAATSLPSCILPTDTSQNQQNVISQTQKRAYSSRKNTESSLVTISVYNPSNNSQKRVDTDDVINLNKIDPIIKNKNRLSRLFSSSFAINNILSILSSNAFIEDVPENDLLLERVIFLTTSIQHFTTSKVTEIDDSQSKLLNKSQELVAKFASVSASAQSTSKILFKHTTMLSTVENISIQIDQSKDIFNSIIAKIKFLENLLPTHLQRVGNNNSSLKHYPKLEMLLNSSKNDYIKKPFIAHSAHSVQNYQHSTLPTQKYKQHYQLISKPLDEHIPSSNNFNFASMNNFGSLYNSFKQSKSKKEYNCISKVGNPFSSQESSTKRNQINYKISETIYRPIRSPNSKYKPKAESNIVSLKPRPIKKNLVLDYNINQDNTFDRLNIQDNHSKQNLPYKSYENSNCIISEELNYTQEPNKDIFFEQYSNRGLYSYNNRTPSNKNNDPIQGFLPNSSGTEQSISKPNITFTRRKTICESFSSELE